MSARLALALALTLACGAAGACDRRTWTGPLAPAADSVLASPPAAACDTAGVYYELDDVERPLRGCVATRGDTTFTVFADRSGRVAVVWKAIRVEPASQMRVHDSIEFTVGSQYEAPVTCAEVGGPVETVVRLWNTLDRQIVLKNLGTDRVLLELRADHPKCHAGAAAAAGAPVGLALDWERSVGVAVPRGDTLCFRIKDADLATGERVLLVSPDDGSRRESKVAATLPRCSDEAPLFGWEYYRLEAEPRPGPEDILVGVVDPSGPDLDADGAEERFRTCTSGEGVHLTVWSGPPLGSPRRWHYYYPLGYDVEPTCEEADYAG